MHWAPSLWYLTELPHTLMKLMSSVEMLTNSAYITFHTVIKALTNQGWEGLLWLTGCGDSLLWQQIMVEGAFSILMSSTLDAC